MCIHTLYTKLLQTWKHLSSLKEKGCSEAWYKKISVISRGVGGFVVRCWPQSWSQRCFKRKTPKLTFRPQSKPDPLVKKKVRRGEEFSALSEKRTGLGLVDETCSRKQSQLNYRRFKQQQFYNISCFNFLFLTNKFMHHLKWRGISLKIIMSAVYV